jgi:hypothetical protein
MKQVASLQYGVIFKKAFVQVDIFKAFVKAVLDIELEIDKVETEKSFKSTMGYVDSRFDLFAQVNENTPIRYKEWLEAIKDTLDGKVEESNYHDVMIQKIFNTIEEDGITPTERYAMFEEYDQREIAETRLKNKLKFIVNNMVAEGLSLEIISKVTGLTVAEIENSSDEYFDDE